MCRWADTRHCHTGKAKQPGCTRRSQRPPQQHPRTGAATIASPMMRGATGRACCCHGIRRCRTARPHIGMVPRAPASPGACHRDSNTWVSVVAAHEPKLVSSAGAGYLRTARTVALRSARAPRQRAARGHACVSSAGVAARQTRNTPRPGIEPGSSA